jgi:hypothetical protein
MSKEAETVGEATGEATSSWWKERRKVVDFVPVKGRHACTGNLTA